EVGRVPGRLSEAPHGDALTHLTAWFDRNRLAGGPRLHQIGHLQAGRECQLVARDPAVVVGKASGGRVGPTAPAAVGWHVGRRHAGTKAKPKPKPKPKRVQTGHSHPLLPQNLNAVKKCMVCAGAGARPSSRRPSRGARTPW